MVEIQPYSADLATQAPLLERLVAAFLAGYGKSTRISYRDVLVGWVPWCLDRGVDPLAVQRAHIDLWGRWMAEERHLSPATVQHHLCVLRSFYGYLAEEEYITSSPAAKVRLPKLSGESPTRGMTVDEVRRFLAAASTDKRAYALCSLLVFNGVRVSEACSADIADLGEEGGVRTLTITRKGGKRQTLPVAPPVVTALDAMLDGRMSGPLFLSADGRRLSRFSAYKMVAKAGEAAGLAEHVHPHRLRHVFATVALDAGVPLVDVQDSMGHQSSSSTMRYNRSRHKIEKNATWKVMEAVNGQAV